MNKVTLLQNQEIAPGIFSLTFKRFFEFIPGQVIKITCDQTVAPRIYSIASGNREAYVQLVYDIKPEGELTNILKNLKSGSELLVSLPFGQFICNENDAWWIATGTGIAPFYAMIQSEPKPEVKLIHGVRRPESFIFKDDLKNLLNKNYIQCCSGDPAKDIFYGRVTDYLRSMEKLPLEKKFYLCGSAEMVVDVRDILIIKGVPFGNIYSEIYF